MQLLDLNEGKILELGKDFLYGGDFIVLNYDKDIFGDGITSDNIYCESFKRTPFSQSTHTKLIPILEKKRAELFGDRYVLIDDLNKFIVVEYIQLACGEPRRTLAKYFQYKNLLTHENMIYCEILNEVDLLEEFSLLLKGEPNKFEEFCELVK